MTSSERGTAAREGAAFLALLLPGSLLFGLLFGLARPGLLPIGRAAFAVAPFLANFDRLFLEFLDCRMERSEEVRIRGLAHQFVVVVGNRYFGVIQVAFVRHDDARLHLAAPVIQQFADFS